MVVTSLAIFGPPVSAQEVCGLQSAVYDVIFANGFQAASGTLGNALGTVPSPTIGTTPTIVITYPAASAQLPANHTAVAGTFTGPDHTGITVNGKTGYTYNNSFLVPDVPVDASHLTLQATATTLDELSATASNTVQLPAPTPSVRLDTDASVGLSPFNIDFFLRADASLTVQSFTITYGDGGTFTGSTGATAIPSHNYTTPGIYIVGASVSTSTGSMTVDHRVIILDVQQLRNRVCGVYSYLRAELTAQDVPHALQAYDPVDRPRYQTFFTSAGSSQLAPLAGLLGTIASGLVGPNEAHMTVVKTVGGVVQGFPIEFAPDENGVWRIRQM